MTDVRLIQLTVEQHRKLEIAARKSGLSKSQFIDQYIAATLPQEKPCRS